MKKNIIFIIIGLLTLSFSCSKEKEIKPEPIPDPIKVEYAMPMLTLDKIALKENLLKIAEDVIEVTEDNHYKITCTPSASESNMFASLSYEFKYDGTDFKELNFSYKLDESLKLTQENKDKVRNYIKESILK